MHTVKSKYKNPDRMIQKLKQEIIYANRRTKNREADIESLKEENKQIRKSVIGDYWFDYSKGVTKGVSFNDVSSAKAARLDDTVFLKGKVIKIVVSRNPKESEATFEIESVYIKK